MIPLLNFIGLVVSFLGKILFCDACERVPVCVKRECSFLLRLLEAPSMAPCRPVDQN